MTGDPSYFINHIQLRVHRKSGATQTPLPPKIRKIEIDFVKNIITEMRYSKNEHKIFHQKTPDVK